ncbi:MAG TPA: transporter [Desulfomonilia bacterium]|nr:transporter [Desulfomonilia bacterium]HRV36897.1 transporter [Desulfomonilia bacterium]
MRTTMKNISILMVLLILACPVVAFADDSMDFFPLAPGTNMFNLYYNKISADTFYADGSKANEDFNLRGDIGVFRGAAYYNVGPFTALTALLVPFGNTNLDTTVSTPGGPVQVHAASPAGLGDILLHTAVWVVNDKEKGFFFAPDLFITPPTGEYDKDKNMNMGENRWSFMPGLAVAKVLTSKGTFAQAKISTKFYTKNDEYTTATGVTGCGLEQEPLYQFQGFLTQFLNQKTYISLNYFYNYGGETKVDGVKQDDKIKTHSVQFGISRNIAENVDLLIKYTKDVSVDNGPMTDVFGIRLTYLFPPDVKN